MNDKHIPENLNCNTIISIGGESLPEALVKALKNYQPTQFQTKSKEDLLAMLVSNKDK